MTRWTTHGLWGLTAPPPPPCEPLTTERAADVVIVGGGYTGISAALTLAEGGASVVLLEAEDVGFGASGRNTGLLNAGLSLPPRQVVERLGAVRGTRIVRALGEGPRAVMEIIRRYDIDCELETNGTLYCAVSSVGLREIVDLAQQWNELGAPVDVLDADATAEKIGTSLFRGSIWDHRASTLQPLAYARGLARAALSAGAAIHNFSRVISLNRRSTKWGRSHGARIGSGGLAGPGDQRIHRRSGP